MKYLFVFLLLTGCSYSNIENIKENAKTVWNQNGFEIAGYEGYTMSFLGFGTSFGGACVWYRLKNIPDNGVSYDGCLYRWGKEYHVYDLRAIDAIKP